MRVLNLIINKFITDKVLKAAYLEKPLNEKYEDIHLHLIFVQEINKNDIFKIIKTLLDDATFVTYYVIKNNIYHAVSEDNMQPGDIIIWSSNGYSPTHSSIYVGGDQMIHAANSGTGVIQSSVSWWESAGGGSIATIRRV